MNSIKVIVRKFVTKKEGKEFYTLKAKGKYLPLATVSEDVNYDVRLVGDVKLSPKASEGIYEVAYENKGLWHDQRDAEKHIVRCKATRIVFQKPLPVFDKDVRLDKEAK
jgi:hypothetical protein